MLHASVIEVFLEGVPFIPLRSFVLEQLEDIEALMITLIDQEGQEYVCFVERFESPNRIYCKDAASALACSRAQVPNPDWDPND